MMTAIFGFLAAVTIAASVFMTIFGHRLWPKNALPYPAAFNK